MSQQIATVFMTEQQQYHHHQLGQEQKTTTTVSCEYCKKVMNKKGYFYILENEIHFFHDALCKFKYTKRQERRKQKILKQESRLKPCLKCSKLFDPKFIKKRKYCSRSCSRNNQPNHYDKFYYCNSCTSWIKHEDAKLKKNNIISFPMCPKRDCKDNRLRTKSRINK